MNINLTKLSPWSFEVRSNDIFLLEPQFRYKTRVLEYNYKLKRMVPIIVDSTHYTISYENALVFGIGWLEYFYIHFKDLMDEKSIELCESIYYDEVNDFESEFLEGEAYTDVLAMLTRQRGLNQLPTGEGKTEQIAAMAHYFYKKGLRTLIITPGSKQKDEIAHRLKSRYGYELPYFSYLSNLNLISTNGFLRSNQFDPDSEYWSGVDVVLADEVEYTLSTKGIELLACLSNLKYQYGFSATADKAKAEVISFENRSSKIIERNSELISMYGQCIVFRPPTNVNVNMITIKTNIFQNSDRYTSPYISKDEFEAMSYVDIISTIFKEDYFCKGFNKILMGHKGVFVPINRLEIIDNWLKNYFIDKDKLIICISSRGYEVFSEGKKVANLKLSELKFLIHNELVDVIVGTKSAYSSLDFPKLNAVLCLTSSLASITLQCVGRVARSKNFDFINLESYHVVPCYTYDSYKRKRLVVNYYGKENITTKFRKDIDYGIV